MGTSIRKTHGCTEMGNSAMQPARSSHIHPVSDIGNDVREGPAIKTRADGNNINHTWRSRCLHHVPWNIEWLLQFGSCDEFGQGYCRSWERLWLRTSLYQYQGRNQAWRRQRCQHRHIDNYSLQNLLRKRLRCRYACLLDRERQNRPPPWQTTTQAADSGMLYQRPNCKIIERQPRCRRL